MEQNSMALSIFAVALFVTLSTAAVLPGTTIVRSTAAVKGNSQGQTQDPSQQPTDPGAIAALASALGGDDNPVVETLENAQDKLAEAASNVQDAVSDVVENAQDKIADVVDAAKDALSTEGQQDSTAVEEAESQQGVVSDAVDDMQDAMSDAIENVQDVLEDTDDDAVDDMQDAVGDAVDNMQDAMDDAADNMQDAFEDLVENNQGAAAVESPDGALDTTGAEADDDEVPTGDEFVDEMLSAAEDTQENLQDAVDDVFENVAEQVQGIDDSVDVPSAGHSEETVDVSDDGDDIFDWIDNDGISMDNELSEDSDDSSVSGLVRKMSKAKRLMDIIDAQLAESQAAKTGTCPMYPVQVDTDRVTITTHKGCKIVIKLKGASVDGIHSLQDNMADLTELERSVEVSYMSDS